MENAAITGGAPEVKPPVVTPPAATAPQNQGGVTLTKEEHEKLVKDSQDLATARILQAQADKRADRFEKLVGRKGKSPFAKSDVIPPAAPTKEEFDAQATAEDRKAERGLMAVAVDPKYRELLDADPTLRNLLVQNPLGALPILAADALDAEDAVGLVREQLDLRLTTFKKTPPGAPVLPVEKITPPTPPAGGINTPGGSGVDEYEAARKIGNTENAIARMIKVGASRMGKK